MEKLRDNSPSLSAKPSLCTSIHSKKPRDCVGPITRTYRQDTLLLQRKRQALNSKTEFLLISLSKQLAKMHNSSFNTTHSAWNLGFIFSMNTSPFLTSAHLSPNPRCINVSVHTSIPKQPSPSPLPLFTPSFITATIFITTCPSLRSPGSNRPRTLSCTSCCQSSQIQSHHSHPIRSLHWLKIT